VPTEEHAQRGLRGGRMEAFSDGVFAIAITLLVLDLEVPGDTGEGLLRGLLEQWPSYLAYVVSFATVGAVWLGHLAVTGFLHHADVWLLRLNLLLLLLVAALSFPTRLLAGGIASEGDARVATVTYGIVLLAVAGALSTLWRYAVRQGLVHPDARDADVRRLTRALRPGLAGYVAMILLGLVLPLVAVLGYLVVAVAYLVPLRAIRPAQGNLSGRGRSTGATAYCPPCRRPPTRTPRHRTGPPGPCWPSSAPR